jgi:hypothetical protein
MIRGEYGLWVVSNGKPGREYEHNGTIWLEGDKGAEFTLRVRNGQAHRVLAVVSVDGLSVMNGKTASYKSGGYILEPHCSEDIPGWRLNLDEVARFFFATLGASYAAKMDKPANIGVIGCAFFTEMQTIEEAPSSAPGSYYEGAPMPPSRRSPAPPCPGPAAPELGTGFGKKTKHHVQQLEFDRASDGPDAVLSLRYDSRRGLEARGIVLAPPPGEPNPFPGEFCAPPPGWK